LPFMYLDEGPIYYEVYGCGRWLTLVHGMFASHKWWRFQKEEFSKDYKVIVLDLPGHGRSYSLKRRITLDEYAKILNDLHESLRVDRTILIGWSLGGIVSMHYAVKYPGRVAGLVVISSRCSRNPWRYRFRNFISNLLFGFRMAFESLVLTGETEKTVDYKEMLRGELMKGVSKDVPIEYLEELVNEMIDSSVGESYDYLIDSGLEYDVSEEIVDIDVPTLILVGDLDKKTPVKYSLEIHNRIKNSILRVVKGGTHYMMVEKPKTINKMVREFLSQINY